MIVGFVPLQDFNLGDNLEQHAIGWFRRCWNSVLVCRRCIIKYDDLSSENGFLRHTPWSSLRHSEVNEGNECPLNQLHGFDATKNLPFDFMHIRATNYSLEKINDFLIRGGGDDFL